MVTGRSLWTSIGSMAKGRRATKDGKEKEKEKEKERQRERKETKEEERAKERRATREEERALERVAWMRTSASIVESLATGRGTAGQPRQMVAKAEKGKESGR